MQAIYLTLRRWGWDPRKTLVAIRGTRRFHRDARQFRKQQKHLGGADPFPRGPRYPVYGEWNSDGGTASGAYFHQDLFVAREVFRRSTGSILILAHPWTVYWLTWHHSGKETSSTRDQQALAHRLDNVN